MKSETGVNVRSGKRRRKFGNNFHPVDFQVNRRLVGKARLLIASGFGFVIVGAAGGKSQNNQKGGNFSKLIIFATC